MNLDTKLPYNIRSMPEFEPGEGCEYARDCKLVGFCQVASLVRGETDNARRGWADSAKEQAAMAECKHPDAIAAKSAANSLPND